MTKEEACKLLGIKIYDTALPQSWFDVMNQIFGGSSVDVLPNFVWSYDDAILMGAPRPLTDMGCVMLICYNRIYDGSNYPVAYRVLKAPYQTDETIDFKAPHK
jgi:hypothetical protein